MLCEVILIGARIMTGMTKRVQVTMPDRLAEDLEKWAKFDGRPISNLCAFLLEQAVKEAKKDGLEWAHQQEDPVTSKGK